MTPLLAPELDQYIRDLLPARDPVLAEMEQHAAQNDVPIVGPAVGSLLEILARSIGADRIFEMGSAIGYSTAFFARAVGRGGQVFYTDGDPANAERARGYLERMGFAGRVTIRVGDAIASLEQTTGYFDVVFIDVDKDGYPAALKAAAPRVRRGGYLIADNVLWSGKVVDAGVRDKATEGIRHFNRTLFALQEFRSVIVPLRDGVAIARREGEFA
jgi:caffeoyl-CoA O-methyltransferase